MADLAALAKLGASPIPGASPAGVAVRYEPLFEQLQAEIDKLESLAGASVNWRQVVTLSSAILEQKSKDLLIAAYLSRGLLESEGYPGLAAGLSVFRDLLATFWETLFPPIDKMRGRAAAVSWLNERVGRALAERPTPGEPDREPLAACAQKIEEIGALLREKFTAEAPEFGEVQRTIRERIDSIPAPVAPGAENASASSAAETSAPPPPAEIDSAERAREAVLKAVAFFRQANAADPLPYHLVRTLLWSEASEPPANKKGETSLPGPDGAAGDHFEELLSQGDFAKVLEEAEACLLDQRFWLDLNLYGVRAAEGLGPAYLATREAIWGEVASLIRRWPGIIRMKFEGGKPLAGAATRLWMANELVPAGAANPEPSDRLSGALGEARKLVTRGKLGAATALFQKEMQGTAHRRDRFLWHLALARVCAEAGRHDLAMPQLESLDEEAKRFSLDDWEPGLLVDVLKLLWECYGALSPNEGISGKVAPLYARLCQLDLTAAMALKSEKE